VFLNKDAADKQDGCGHQFDNGLPKFVVFVMMLVIMFVMFVCHMRFVF
jgi:hypothetical protein